MDIHFDIVNNLKKVHAKAFYTVNLAEHGQITCLEVSQFDSSQDLVLIGFMNRILLGYLKFTKTVALEILSEFPFPCRCTGLSFSVETNLSVIPSNLLFCAVGSDFRITVFRSDMVNDSICKILDQHSDFINDVKFDFENKFLASASDDNTVKIWEVENYKCCYSIQLDSPGIAVQWHKHDPMKLLIADKIGIIRLYNIENLKPLLSLDAGKMLSSCHWDPSNSLIISSLQLGELSIWDVSVPSPKTSKLVCTEVGGYVKFNSQGDLIATLSPMEGLLKVFKTSLQEPIFSTFMYLPTNFCWHLRYPIIIGADDAHFKIWRINTV